MDTLLAMAEGNPGAGTVLGEMMNGEDPAGLTLVLHLDDMNIRGTQIWIGYKNHCGSDLKVFLQAIKDRDPAMVATINEMAALQGTKEKAVTRGASFT